MTRLLLPFLALSLAAAAPPQRGISLQLPLNNSALLPVPSSPILQPARPGPSYAPAPLPNRDVDAPSGPRASNDTTVAPSLFTRRDEYRGEGFSRGSTSQSEVEKRVKPGAGINLRMPLTGQ